ncbi:MAG: SIMPL domain-containing protein [Candidatus Thorarchaeota archaeon]|jgi:uncharacterized protein YggE
MKVLFAVILSLGMALSAVAEENYVRVSGTAVVQAEPDIAFVRATVTTLDKSPVVALSENNKKMANVFSVLDEDFDVERKFISTSSFSLVEHYEYDQSTKKNVFKGYKVSNSITVTVCELETIGDLVSALINNGANKFNGISFAIENRTELEKKARKLAVENALEKAKLLVETAGSEVGSLVSISEQRVGVHRESSVYLKSTRSADAAPTPVSGGQQGVSVTISATFEINN